MRRTIISDVDRLKIEEQKKTAKSQARGFKKLSQSLEQWKIDEQNEINKVMAKSFRQMQK